MYTSLLTAAMLATSATAMTIAPQRRDLTMTGNPFISFKCDSLTLPQPGTGEQGGSSGSGYFNDKFTMTNPDGSTVAPIGCLQKVCAGTCLYNCAFESDALPAGTVRDVNVEFSPVGGTCSLKFEYNGVSYDSGSGSPNGQCGEDSSFHPFGDTQTAQCYI